MRSLVGTWVSGERIMGSHVRRTWHRSRPTAMVTSVTERTRQALTEPARARRRLPPAAGGQIRTGGGEAFVGGFERLVIVGHVTRFEVALERRLAALGHLAVALAARGDEDGGEEETSEHLSSS